jgi:hypothetical protein
MSPRDWSVNTLLKCVGLLLVSGQFFLAFVLLQQFVLFRNLRASIAHEEISQHQLMGKIIAKTYARENQILDIQCQLGHLEDCP